MLPAVPTNHRYLRDALGRTITEGSCVIDAARDVGHVCPEPGPHRPLRVEVTGGNQVQIPSGVDS